MPVKYAGNPRITPMHATSRIIATRTAAALLALSLLAALGCQQPNALLRRDGMEALDLNDVPAADRKFTAAVQQHATDRKAQYYLGVVRLKQDRALDAQLAEEKALTLRPSDKKFTPLILDALAESLYKQDQRSALSAMLQKAADDYGTVPDYLRQAKYLGLIGDVDGAKLAYRKALKFAPKDDPSPYLAMADYFASVGDTQGAITALGKAYYISPRNERIAERFRRLGIVPGPTVAIKPSEDEAELTGRMNTVPVNPPVPRY
jgi:tetratricopeptide (TPR) repeat protein